MNNIYDYSFEQLQKSFEENKIQKFRVKQVYSWLYQHLVTDFEQMTNVDKKTIAFLEENFYIPKIEVINEQESNDTVKALLKLSDGNTIETVLMRQYYGNSVCVTTQVGCKIGCSFCASGMNGFVRNLSAGEILMQVIYFQRLLEDERVSHIVVMGIGEPLDNYNNVISFIDSINDERSLNIGARHITVSTSGLVDKIYEISEYPKQINLALSLHAPNDELRSQIMKINKTYDLHTLMKAIKHYIEVTNRRVSLEYIMLEGVNDSMSCARELVKLVRGMNVHVNLIKYNEVEEFNYKSSPNSNITSFFDYLDENRIQVSIRKSMGNEIDGACGQLRLNNE